MYLRIIFVHLLDNKVFQSSLMHGTNMKTINLRRSLKTHICLQIVIPFFFGGGGRCDLFFLFYLPQIIITAPMFCK